MKTYTGVGNVPPFKINGTNADLQRFEAACLSAGLQVSKANGYFRDDYEHCLMPAYSYNDHKPENGKLQLLSSDVYFPDLVYDLATDWDSAMSMVEIVNQVLYEPV